MTAKKTTTTEKVVKTGTPDSKQPGPVTETPTPELSKQDQKEVKVIERVIESREIAPADAFGKLTRPQLELIKRTVAKGATDDELRLFIQVCKGANLNPFLRQVHLVKRWDSKTGQEVGAIQVGIDGFRAVAESSGQYAGNDDPNFEGEDEITYDSKIQKGIKLTVPKKATVTVYKLLEGQRYGFTATARWSEYYPGAKMGFQWHIRPYLMLGKCAEALALRKAFPKLLSGMYAAEEMDRGRDEEQAGRRVSTAFDKLKAAIATADKVALEDYQKKIVATDKYTDAQKAELAQLVEARLSDLTKSTE